MKKLILYFLLCFSFTAFSQVVTVKDKETKKAIEQATLVSEFPNISTTTNAKGQVDLTSFKGVEQIEIYMFGYETLKKSYNEIEADGYVIYLKPSTLLLDEVVISNNKWDQLSKDLPNKITTISPKFVALQNPQTAADMLATSGDVFIQKSQQGGGSPMIRGFSTNRLLYTVDGIRMNTAIFRSGNIQNVISLDPLAIEHTEVLFGPGSVIYGSDAIGGVMTFQTLTPQLSYNDTVLATGKGLFRFASANNERTGHFDVSLGWKKWAMVTSFSNNNFGDLRMGSNGPEEYLRPFYVQRQDSQDVVITNNDPLVQVPTAYSQINLMQKLRFKPNEKWDLQYGFHYSTTTNYSRYDRLIRLRKGLPRSAEWYYGPQKWMMNNLSIAHTGIGKLYDKLIVRIAHQHFEESRVERNLNSSDKLIRIEKVNAYSLNVDFTKTIAKKHNLFYGVEVVYDDVNSIGEDEDISTGTIVEASPRYPKSDWASYAAYASYLHKISEKFLLQAGIRYNLYKLNAKFDTTLFSLPYNRANIQNGAITGSLGAVYHPMDKWTIRANASTGFRSPNVDDVGKVFDSTPGSVMVPNPNLQAEYAYNAELGLAKLFGDALKIEVTGYYTLLKNAMVRRNFTLNGIDSIIYGGELSQVQAIQNAAKATVYGVQAGFEAKLPYGFGVSSKFNYQNGEEELDDETKSPLRSAAPSFGISHLTYTNSSLMLDFYAVYSGGKSFEKLPQEEQGKDYIYAIDEKGKPYSPSWYTLNFKVLYSLNDNLAISGGIENITDQRYRPYSSGIVAPGRNIILALRAGF